LNLSELSTLVLYLSFRVSDCSGNPFFSAGYARREKDCSGKHDPANGSERWPGERTQHPGKSGGFLHSASFRAGNAQSLTCASVSLAENNSEEKNTAAGV